MSKKITENPIYSIQLILKDRTCSITRRSISLRNAASGEEVCTRVAGQVQENSSLNSSYQQRLVPSYVAS